MDKSDTKLKKFLKSSRSILKLALSKYDDEIYFLIIRNIVCFGYPAFLSQPNLHLSSLCRNLSFPPRVLALLSTTVCCCHYSAMHHVILPYVAPEHFHYDVMHQGIPYVTPEHSQILSSNCSNHCRGFNNTFWSFVGPRNLNF